MDSIWSVQAPATQAPHRYVVSFKRGQKWWQDELWLRLQLPAWPGERRGGGPVLSCLAGLHVCILLPSIRTSSETLGDGKSISRQLSLELRLSFHLRPTIHLSRTGENTSSKTQQKQGRGCSNWGTRRLKCILQVLVHHQKDIWISTEIWCIIISISLHVSGGLTKEQTKDKFKFFS